eukprot:TRINITY_DN8670_c0_g2_i1.p1 TRINITY_DN8670_c0_g2~~TRINITY_DN8670_c0_g2_i1.p1  ORF type:complete len:831 (+),score=232.76 TRINITY_DN8670_c0_g2_i1:56-2548(+)
MGEIDDMAARSLAEEAMMHTLRTEFGRAAELLEGNHKKHPRLAVEWANLHLAKSVVQSVTSGLEQAAAFYLRAAELAEGDGCGDSTMHARRPPRQGWAQWAYGSSAQFATVSGQPPRTGFRERNGKWPWVPLKAFQMPDPDEGDARDASPENSGIPCTMAHSCWSLRTGSGADLSFSGDITDLDRERAACWNVAQTTGEDLPVFFDDPDCTAELLQAWRRTTLNRNGMAASLRTDTSASLRKRRNRQDIDESPPRSPQNEAATPPPGTPTRSRSVADAGSIRHVSTMPTLIVSQRNESQQAVLCAEALTLAAALQLTASEHVQAAANLRRAWHMLQPLREAVHDDTLNPFLAEDVRFAVGVFQALTPELPDGLRKVLAGVAPIAPKGDESRWLIEVFAACGKRSTHAGAALVWQQLVRPGGEGLGKESEAQVLQALVLRHPQSVLLHLAVSVQRRRHGDACGALDAVAAARRMWEHPRSRCAGRPKGSPLPPLLLLLIGDAHFSSLDYRAASRYYRKLLDIAAVSGEQLDCQGRASVRLAAVMTQMKKCSWPGQQWGTADEWLHRAVVLARTNRREEEAAAGVAARFGHLSQLRPLLGYWQLFLMGDLECMGPVQRAEVVAGLRSLARGNPGPPPAEDHLAYAEGQALQRLLLGAAMHSEQPEEATALWRRTLLDPSLPDTSVAVAYIQCLLGEMEARIGTRESLQRAAKLLTSGAQLPGDRSTQLRVRYGEALRQLPPGLVDGMLPFGWASLVGADASDSPQRQLPDRLSSPSAPRTSLAASPSSAGNGSLAKTATWRRREKQIAASDDLGYMRDLRDLRRLTLLQVED